MCSLLLFTVFGFNKRKRTCATIHFLEVLSDSTRFQQKVFPTSLIWFFHFSLTDITVNTLTFRYNSREKNFSGSIFAPHCSRRKEYQAASQTGVDQRKVVHANSSFTWEQEIQLLQSCAPSCLQCLRFLWLQQLVSDSLFFSSRGMPDNLKTYCFCSILAQFLQCRRQVDCFKFVTNQFLLQESISLPFFLEQ